MEMVSIIIPTYNRNELVRTAVKSALMQTYPKIEVIVVDGSSGCETFEILKEFKDKITIIKDKKNIGVAAARNLGIKESSGKYITNLDDDDFFHPRKIEWQIKVFNKKKNLGLVYCPRATLVNNKLIYVPARKEKNHWIRLTHQNHLIMTPLIKKECFSVCGVFDESLLYHEDRDLWYRIGKKFQLDFDSYPSYIFYSHNIDRLSLQLEKICQGKKTLYEKHKNDFEDRNKLFSDLHYELAYAYLRFGQYRKSLKHFQISIKKNPEIIKRYLGIHLGKIRGRIHKTRNDGGFREMLKVLNLND